MKAIGIFVILLFGFLGGAFCTFGLLWPAGDAVKIHVINKSGLNISSIEITHKDGSVSINTLGSGDSEMIPVHVSAESSYLIVATFENGMVVGGEGGYVEPGYRVTETISKRKIQHDFESFY